MGNSNRGFTLTSVLMAAGLAGALAMGMGEILNRINQGERKLINMQDQVQLTLEVNSLLNDENHCRVSLAGPGSLNNPTTPVTFVKSDIDGAGEGLNVEIYRSDTSGTARKEKKFTATAGDARQVFGKLKIKSIKLRLDATTGAYTNCTMDTDRGEVLMTVEKKVGANKKESLLKFPISVTVFTDQSGTSTIYSCSATSRGGGGGGIPIANICTNLIAGNRAGDALTRGSNNVLVGHDAGAKVTTGNNNTFMGESAGKNTTTGSDNSFFGFKSGLENTTGREGVFTGFSSGYSNTSGNSNVFIGDSAGYRNTTGGGKHLSWNHLRHEKHQWKK